MAQREELTSTENKVSYARQAYNDFVMVYSTSRQSFPNNILAGMSGFSATEQLQATKSADERMAPQLKFWILFR